jgi:putative hemolysin
LAVLILILLILLNGFFALAEIAFVAANKRIIDKLAAEGSDNAREVALLMENPQYFLSSIQVGITLIGILTGVYGGITFVDDIIYLLEYLGLKASYADEVAMIITIGGITYFAVIFGELVPKSYALARSEKIALYTVPIVKRFAMVLYPFVWLLTVSTKLLTKLLGIQQKETESLSEEELQYMLKVAGNQGILEYEESVVFQNLFSFTDRSAVNLMTPREQLQWIDQNWTAQEIANFIHLTPATKFPVCEGDLDNLRGVIYAKEYLEAYVKGETQLTDLLHEPLFLAPETSSFGILTQFRQQKEYIGFVKNQSGRILGLVTLRDLIEAIIGDLPQPSDEEEEAIIARGQNSWLVDADITMDTFNQFFGEHALPENPDIYHTLGGYILYSQTDKPYTGMIVEVEGFTLEVVDMDGSAIDKILVSRV